MSWRTPTRKELVDETIAQLQTEHTADGRTIATGPGSEAQIKADVFAGGVGYGLILQQEQLVRDVTAVDATGEQLVKMAVAKGLSDGLGGYGRIQPRGSSAEACFRVTASSSTGDLQGEQIQDASGRLYQITESFSFPSSGSADLDGAAISTGLATNLRVAANPTLSFVSPPAGVTGVTLVVDLGGGADLETYDELRERVLRRERQPPRSGNGSEWREVIEGVSPGEYRAFVWPQRQNQPFGYGTTDYAATVRGKAGAERIPTATQIAEIDAGVLAKLPKRQMLAARHLTLTESQQDVEITLTMADGAAGEDLCDWDAESVKWTTVTGSSSTRVVQLSASVGTTIAVGDRVIILPELAAASIAAGDLSDVSLAKVQGVVDSVASGDVDEITVATWPELWPTTLSAGSYVMSGGGVIWDVLRAILVHINGLGPVRDDYAEPWLDWEDRLTRLAIQTAAIQAAGGRVADVGVLVPMVDIDLTDAGPSTVGLITIDTAIAWEVKP